MSGAMPDWVEEAVVEAEEQFIEALAPVFRDSIARYAKTLVATGDLAAFDGTDARITLVVEEMVAGVWGEVYLTAVVEAGRAAPAAPAAWPDVVNEKAITYQTTATNRIVGSTQALWGDVKDRVIDNLQVGVDIDVLTKEIENVTGYATRRARTIARTETLGAYNGGAWDGVKALGDWGPTYKSWLTGIDGRQRDSHRIANNQVRPIDEPFDLDGYPLMYPHAAGGAPEEVINCRCVMLQYWPGDMMPDGNIAPEPEPEPSVTE